MKKCSKCNVEKYTNEFNKCKTFKDGLQRYCRTCSNISHKEWYDKNKSNEQNKALVRYYLSKEYGVDMNLKRRYNITKEQQLEMAKKQNGICANANCEKLWGATDHNHSTGLVRGLLCRECNLALGHLGDNFDKVIGLAKYLHEAEGII